MAADPLDAAVVGIESRIDRNGVIVIDTDWHDPRLRKDISLTDAIAWANAKAEPLALMLFDADSRRSRLAELRMQQMGAAERVINRVAITRPQGHVEFVDEAAELASTEPVLASAPADGVSATHSETALPSKGAERSA